MVLIKIKLSITILNLSVLSHFFLFSLTTNSSSITLMFLLIFLKMSKSKIKQRLFWSSFCLVRKKEESCQQKIFLIFIKLHIKVANSFLGKQIIYTFRSTFQESLDICFNILKSNRNLE